MHRLNREAPVKKKKGFPPPPFFFFTFICGARENKKFQIVERETERPAISYLRKALSCCVNKPQQRVGVCCCKEGEDGPGEEEEEEEEESV